MLLFDLLCTFVFDNVFEKCFDVLTRRKTCIESRPWNLPTTNDTYSPHPILFLWRATTHISRVSARLSCADGPLSCPEATTDAPTTVSPTTAYAGNTTTDTDSGGKSSVIFIIGISICVVVGIVGVAVAAWACLRDSHPGEKAIEM